MVKGFYSPHVSETKSIYDIVSFSFRVGALSKLNLVLLHSLYLFQKGLMWCLIDWFIILVLNNNYVYEVDSFTTPD